MCSAMELLQPAAFNDKRLLIFPSTTVVMVTTEGISLVKISYRNLASVCRHILRSISEHLAGLALPSHIAIMLKEFPCG